MRNPTTWFQLGVTRDAGPEITNGLGAFLYAARSKPGFVLALSLVAASARQCPRASGMQASDFFCLPICQDELSVLEVPIATA